MEKCIDLIDYPSEVEKEFTVTVTGEDIWILQNEGYYECETVIESILKQVESQKLYSLCKVMIYHCGEHREGIVTGYAPKRSKNRGESWWWVRIKNYKCSILKPEHLIVKLGDKNGKIN